MAHQLSNTHSPARSRDEMVNAAKKKLKTFRAKQAQSSVSSTGSIISRRRSRSRGSSISSTTECLPSSLSVATEAPKHHQKRRSHSRSASILKVDTDHNLPQLPTVTLPTSPFKPANLGDLNRSFSFGGPKPAVSPMTSPLPPSSPPCAQQTTPRPRPSSHHRRRSSVSTRRDSVDMMGFDPASLNALKTLGENDKDDVSKVRERALLALEGKTPKAKARTIPEILPNMGFTKVEIPEWKTPDVELSFDWGATTNRPKSLPFSINLNGAGASKRDSFGKNTMPSASSKGELAVLVEEEEEEESSGADKENIPLPQPAAPAPQPVSTPVSSPVKSISARSPSLSPTRPRPASLNLKALAMVPSTTVVSLPTPSATPSPTPGARPGMKPLNLGNATRRQSMIALSSNSSRNSLPSRRQSLRSLSRDSGSTHSSKDSLSSASRLPPTPSTMSPTSAVEGFLQKNQELLISRIDQLEKALASSRRASLQSNMSHSSTASSIAEEQINLIAELKSERNALVEDIAGWRTRVEDLERQAALYLKKVDSERTESKLARERVLELEKEQSTWESDRKAFNDTIARAREDGASWRAKYEEALKGECHWQAKALGLETDVKRLEKELAALRTVSPTKKWNVTSSPRRFDDSMSSTSTADVRDETYVVSSEADVFKIRPRPASPLLNMDVVVEEEEEEVYESSCEGPNFDDDNEPRCVEEDEEEVSSDILDEVNGDQSGSESVDSFTSQYTQPHQPTFQEPQPTFKFPGAFPDPAPAPTSGRGHARTGSMVKGWQMPRGPVQSNNRSPAKPDRFFDQLEHFYATNDEEPTTPTNPSFENVQFGSPEFSTFKGDGGASSFKFGSKRNSISVNYRGHGTRASRASISVAAFNGLGMPPFMDPNPEWVVKNESPEPLSPLPGTTNTDKPLDSNAVAHLQAVSSDGEPPAREFENRTPTTPKPPKFIAAPTARNTLSTIKTASTNTPSTSTPRITNSSSSCTSNTATRALVRRKPSLTRVQPTGRTPPQVPVDTSHDVSRSPFSVSYSRTSSRSSRHDSIVGAETAAIEAAIAQAQAASAASRRLTFTGLSSLLPWGMISGASGEPTKPLCAVVESGVVDEERTTLLVPKVSGAVTREAQLERLRRELGVAGRPVVGVNSSAPCCSRCKPDVIEL